MTTKKKTKTYFIIRDSDGVWLTDTYPSAKAARDMAESHGLRAPHFEIVRVTETVVRR